jgi:cyclopropane fatty-acyl-phospholipid synthase-like methyltransferase
MDKPVAPSCARNQAPILAVLQPLLRQARSVLEIGSGTGQHAVHFAAAMPQLRWQASDRSEQLPGIGLWLDEAALPNTPAPIALDVAEGPWPDARFDAVFTANTLHIMGWPQVRALFEGVASVLAPGGVLAVYGPFNEGGEYTSPSNAAFDQWLKARDPQSAIRDVERVHALAQRIGLNLQADHAMPANNRLLVWRR